MYVTGYTLSSDFPTANPVQAASAGDYDAFIAKLSASGTVLVYSTFLGGSSSDFCRDIAVDASGSAYVSGYTNSSDFPVQNSYDSSYGGYGDVFVTKLVPAGNALEYSTYLGGSNSDIGRSIAVDASGSAHLAGYTNSSDFPTQIPYDGSYNGGLDVFVTKLVPTGSALGYSTFLGGGYDQGNGIALDDAGNAYITGVTESSGFPTQNPYDGSLEGSSDAFVTKLSLPCACDCHADPSNCDGVQEITDVVRTIDVAFSAAAGIPDPNVDCPYETTDTDCSGATDIVDVVKMINVVFRNADSAIEFCEPCL